ncbi:MAG TPA: WxL domain-containing protein [Actinomycetota bacterium]|nr:WxL domain-containing protein [Actinomycetota bacterium]
MRARIMVVGIVAGATVWAFAPQMALASDPTDLPIVGGSLGITAEPTAPNFAQITLNGVAQTAQVSLSVFEVNDARGSGAGWHVTAQASRFAEHNGTIYVPLGKQLPLNSLTMSAPTVAQDGTTSANPSITGGAPYTIDSGSAVTIASAAVDAGMGKYDFSATNLTVSVPSSAYARTYRSDLTVSVVSGP